MLTALFKAFLGVTLSLSLLILLFSLAGPAVRKRYDPRLSSRVWLVFALRLLLPIPINNRSPLLISAGETVYFLDRDPSVAARAFAEAAPGGTPGGEMLLSKQVGISWMGIGAMIWLGGALVVLLFHLIAQSRMQRSLGRWSTPVRRPETVALFEEAKRALRVTRPIRLSVCLRISSPMLVGFFRPHILLPCDNLQERQLTSIFHHELTHYKRGDLWYKLLLMTALALHWYNPFAYLLVWQAENAMELACDADVLRGYDISRKEYGLAMLSQLLPAGKPPLILSTQFYGGTKYMKIRIRQIADTSRKKSGRITLLFCTALILAGSLLIGCAPLSAVALLTPSAAQHAWVQESAPASSAPAEESIAQSEGTSLSEGDASDLYVWRADEDDVGATHSENGALNADAQQQLLERLERIAANSRLKYAGGTMAWPASEAEYISMPYGWFGDGQFFHSGIDISGKEVYGTPAVAAQAGTVAFVEPPAQPGSGYGRYILLDHGDGIITLYAHLSQILVREGDDVAKGQQIGEIGATGDATGPHLHFEVLENGKHVDPSGYLLTQEPEEVT